MEFDDHDNACLIDNDDDDNDDVGCCGFRYCDDPFPRVCHVNDGDDDDDDYDYDDNYDDNDVDDGDGNDDDDDNDVDGDDHSRHGCGSCGGGCCYAAPIPLLC